MLKMALFDCAISEKCCSVDGGQFEHFRPYPGGFESLIVPTAGNLPSKAKNANAQGSPQGGWT